MLLVPLALRANVGFAIYFIIASAAHAMAFYRHAQERERQSLALAASRNQAKLDALQLQLQPHFLFNTLNAISTLVHRDPAAADRLIGDLSDLLRVSLQTTAHEVPLARELELLEHYLAIEKVRLGDRLQIVREIDPDVLGAYVPTLILQPLAENAVRHGLEPRLAAGTLTLRARRDGDTLRLTVADDGVGFDPSIARRARRGIGLANSEERLRTLHDDRARLDFVSPPEGGVRVDVSLPFRTEPTAPAAVEGREREGMNAGHFLGAPRSAPVGPA
jgi:sensor histidine kinase YesM